MTLSTHLWPLEALTPAHHPVCHTGGRYTWVAEPSDYPTIDSIATEWQHMAVDLQKRPLLKSQLEQIRNFTMLALLVHSSCKEVSPSEQFVLCSISPPTPGALHAINKTHLLGIMIIRTELDRPSLIIDVIVTRPDAFFQGVGRTLESHAMKTALLAKLPKISLYPQMGTRPFYTKLGYIGDPPYMIKKVSKL